MSGTSTPRVNGAKTPSVSDGANPYPLPPAPDKTGHHGHYSPEQEQTLRTFEEELTQDGLLPDPLLTDAKQRAIVLGRFLRARDWKVPEAKTMYTESAKWRKEVDIDQLVKAKEDGGFDFEERETVAALGWKMYFHSTDRFHRPIFIQDLSRIQIDEVFKHTTPERIVRFFALNLERAVRSRYAACTEIAKQEARDNGASEEEVDKIIVDDNFMILNVEGLGMGTFWSFKNKLQQLLAILDANFPELSGRVQIIHAPWLFTTIWGYIKPWLPPNTAKKIDIAGADPRSALLPYIDPSELPSSMGGTCTCADCALGCAFSDRGPWNDATGAAAGPASTAAAQTDPKLELPTANAGKESENGVATET